MLQGTAPKGSRLTAIIDVCLVQLAHVDLNAPVDIIQRRCPAMGSGDG